MVDVLSKLSRHKSYHATAFTIITLSLRNFTASTRQARQRGKLRRQRSSSVELGTDRETTSRGGERAGSGAMQTTCKELRNPTGPKCMAGALSSRRLSRQILPCPRPGGITRQGNSRPVGAVQHHMTSAMSPGGCRGDLFLQVFIDHLLCVRQSQLSSE